jgi:hypothetical protein
MRWLASLPADQPAHDFKPWIPVETQDWRAIPCKFWQSIPFHFCFRPAEELAAVKVMLNTLLEAGNNFATEPIDEIGVGIPFIQPEEPPNLRTTFLEDAYKRARDSRS